VVIRELRKRLQDELRTLEHELKVELPQEIKRALALGDLRENAEYHSALERQSYVKARMGQLSKRLGELGSFNMDAIPKDRVGLGSKVALSDIVSGAEVHYTLVMNDDVDTEKGQISIGSPIGRGLAGRRVGDEVTIQIPSGVRKFEILELVTLHDLEQAAAGAVDETSAPAGRAGAPEASEDDEEE
jgi:transcription elongation factor GreA